MRQIRQGCGGRPAGDEDEILSQSVNGVGQAIGSESAMKPLMQGRTVGRRFVR
jgi:hypothetical protein